MKRFISIFILGIAAVLLVNGFAYAQVAQQYWTYVSGTVKLPVSTWTLTIPQLGSSGTPCVDVTNTAGLLGTTTCSGGGGGGSGIATSSLAATWPITLTTNSANATYGFNGLSTTTAAVNGNIPYFSGVNTFANVATSSVTISSPLTSSGTAGSVVGGSGWAIGCQTASGSQAGCLASADWTTFNNKLGSYDPFSHLSNYGVTASATTSSLWVKVTSGAGLMASSTSYFDQILVGSTTSGTMATSTFYGNLRVAGNLQDDTITSSIVYDSTGGTLTAYAGTSCTNQFVRSLNGAGVATCNSVNLASDVTGTLPYGNGGTGTTTAPVSQLLYGGSTAYQSVATTSVSAGTGISLSANPGALVGGSALTISLATPVSIANGGTATTTFYSGGVIFSDGSKLTQSVASANFFWDETNKRLGLATSTPWGLLSVNPNGTTGPSFTVGSTTATNFLVSNDGNVGIATTTHDTKSGIGFTIATSTTIGSAQIASYFSSTTCSTTCNVNWNNGNKQTLYLTGNVNVVMNATSSNPIDGGLYMLRFCQDGTGSRTATFITPGQLRWPTLGATPGATTTISSAANSCSYIGWSYDAVSQLYSAMGSTTGVSRL